MTTRIEFDHCPIFVERPETEVDFNGRLIEVSVRKKDWDTMECVSTLLAAHLPEDDERACGQTDVMSQILYAFKNKNLKVDFCRPFDQTKDKDYSYWGGPEGDILFGGVSYYYTPLRLKLDSNFPDQVMGGHFEILKDSGEEDYILVEARVYVDYAPYRGESYDWYAFIIPTNAKKDLLRSF